MTIKDYIRTRKDDIINGIPFSLFDVNKDEELETTEKTDCDMYATGEEPYPLSFEERLPRAISEIEELTKGMNLEEAYQFFKDNTERDNDNYWGGLIFVRTSEPLGTSILYGIRMD